MGASLILSSSRVLKTLEDTLQEPLAGARAVTLHYVISVLSRAGLPQHSCLWGYQNGILLGNRVFADARNEPEVILGSVGV